eukprot:TRINITY_DN48514_c0_g1_i1.p1 TRINITY_DN48514_c0_g1~~TRINITY_DN48514_c0_g1_i1.p1  ORF type:complete len:164 (+),score=46.99 TRINITY_DN48514_c0_g1_i1:150-641(+)
MMGRSTLLLLAAVFNISSTCVSGASLRRWEDPCPFGYGEHCGSGKPLSEEQKKKVAEILGGLIKHLQGQGESLVQKRTVVTEESSSSNAEVSKAVDIASFGVQKALQQAGIEDTLVKPMVACAKVLSQCSFTSLFQSRPLSDATKAKVAKILEGLIKNLSNKN